MALVGDNQQASVMKEAGQANAFIPFLIFSFSFRGAL
jgi:hypothetical protein